jgi:cyclopropane fatty-acyl-phospholipid synthase-like methyltransferase
MSNFPVIDDVGKRYDALSDTATRTMGGSIHLGYWRDERDNSPISQASERLTDLVIEKSQVTGDRHVLDVGCGTGIPALRLTATTGARVTGITVSEYQVKRATANAQAAGVGARVTFQFADAMALPFLDASFDAAIAIESLLHMSDRATALAHVSRTLREDGRLVVADLLLRRPVPEEKKEIFDSIATMFAINSEINTAEGYGQLIEHAGLELEELTDIGENVRRTYAIMEDELKSNDALVQDLGSEQAKVAASFFRNMMDFQEIGYVLLVAKCPASVAFRNNSLT